LTARVIQLGPYLRERRSTKPLTGPQRRMLGLLCVDPEEGVDLDRKQARVAQRLIYRGLVERVGRGRGGIIHVNRFRLTKAGLVAYGEWKGKGYP